MRRRPVHVAAIGATLVVTLLAGSLAAGASHTRARFFGSLGGRQLLAPVVAFDSLPNGHGYLIAASDGGVFTFGAAQYHGSMGGTRLNAPVVDVTVAPDGDGYALAASDGGIFTFGSARFAGSLGAIMLNQPIRGIVMHPSGRGYWLFAGDGGVFAFGAARFRGSLGGAPPSSPVVSMATTRDGRGYWLATADGRVFAFGNARFFGDARGLRLSAPITSLAATRSGGGYALLGADGGVLTFGTARFHGSAAGRQFVGRMIDLDYAPRGDGYWMLGSDGGVLTFPGTQLPLGGTPTFSVTTVVSGLTIPWDVRFLPRGTMLFTERPGRLNAFVKGQVRVLAAPADVRAVGEGGMTGLAIDPNFRNNRHVYTCMNTTAGDIKVVKWRINRSRTHASRVGTLVAGIPQFVTGRHSGCRLRVGPDRRLWITTGDAATGTNPQNLASLGGKVLRVNRVTGAGVAGNIAGRVYTYGHRNVQGLTFRPGNRHPFTAEHGPNRDDEVNVLVAGGNYGWNPVPDYNESVPMTDLAEFPNAVPAKWSSGFPTIAPSGITFLNNAKWRDWNGGMVMATLAGEHLRLLFFNASDNLVGQRAMLTGPGRMRAVTTRPNGDLYVTTSNGPGIDRILRIRPS